MKTSCASVFAFALIWLLPDISAMAAEPCNATFDSKDYEARGGKLVRANKVDPLISNLPPFFFCDRFACMGDVTFSFVVRQDGTISPPVVVKNTWNIDPEYHASVIAGKVNQIRYRPPRIRGAPVCVKTMLAVALKEGP